MMQKMLKSSLSLCVSKFPGHPLHEIKPITLFSICQYFYNISKKDIFKWKGKTKLQRLHKEIHSVHKSDPWPLLNKIAKTAQLNKRLSPKKMESIILQLCKDYWLTRKQMSDLLQCNPDSLRSHFLTSMVEHGLLRLRYPDKPNRTDQAYKSATVSSHSDVT
jgi:hypothetical protein